MNQQRQIFPEIIWCGELVLYVGLTTYIIMSEKLHLFLHPRLYIFIFLFFILLLLITGTSLLSSLPENDTSKTLHGVLTFALPLLAAVVVLSMAGEETLSTIRTSESLSGIPGGSVGAFIENGDSVPEEKEEAQTDNSEIREKKSEPAQVIHVDQHNYYKIYNDIYNNPEYYYGRTIDITGFVYLDEAFPAETFVLAQMLMWCCAADIAILGFFCEGLDHASLQEEQWLSVRGTLSSLLYENKSTGKTLDYPLITLTDVKTIDPPEYPYVLP